MNHYQLFNQGAVALARMTYNGIAVDVPYYEKQRRILTEDMLEQLVAIRDTQEGALWRRIFRDETSLTSRDQLAKVLFSEQGLRRTSKTKTATGKDSTTLENLSMHNDLPVVAHFLRYQKLQKLASTYVSNILSEQVDGVLHPFFSLHIPATFRSSSQNPNFQNFPLRDPYAGSLIRKGLIARPGRRLVEVDYKAAEVRVGACVHRDPKMIEYINDPSTDMHRDAAADIYCVPREQVSKGMRQAVKGGFVFAAFYGSGYVSCAESLWEVSSEIETVDGTVCMDILKENGITSLGALDYDAPLVPGTFTHHMSTAMDIFWNERFQKYTEWKRWVWKHYKEKGEIDLITGFKIKRPDMRHNQVINSPIQGPAFHCLLWSIIKVQQEIDVRGMETLLVGQVHDSMIADVPEHEFNEFIEMARQVMERDIRDAWQWICVPMEIEVEASPVDGSWADKQEVAI